MSVELVVFAIGALFVLYAIFVIGLLLAGRAVDARAVAGFIPDCIVLFRRLIGDERVSRPRKLSLLALLAYLALPIDLVPDFFPVVGQLDDAILVVLVLRFVLRGAGPQLVDQHWPGPPQGARLIKRFAFGAHAAGPV